MTTDSNHSVDIALISQFMFFKHALLFGNDFVSNHALYIRRISMIHAKITHISPHITITINMLW